MTSALKSSAGLAAATLLPLVLVPLAAPAGRQLPLAIGLLVVVAYAGHVVVSWWLWSRQEIRATAVSQPARVVGLAAGIVACAVVGSAVLSRSLLTVGFSAFLAWQFDHFRRQNVGLVKLVAGVWRSGSPGPGAVLVASAAMWSTVAALLARPSLMGLGRTVLPVQAADPVFGLAELSFFLCLAAGVTLSVGRGFAGRWTPPVCLAYLTAVSFSLPVFLCHRAAGAITGMVIAHGLQYLLVAWQRLGSPRRGGDTRESYYRWRDATSMALLAVVGGAILEGMSERFGSPALGLRMLYGGYLGIVAAHFALDGLLWRQGPRASPLTPTRSPAIALVRSAPDWSV